MDAHQSRNFAPHQHKADDKGGSEVHYVLPSNVTGNAKRLRLGLCRRRGCLDKGHEVHAVALGQRLMDDFVAQGLDIFKDRLVLIGEVHGI